ncbi:MAG: hypothetical protein OEY44_02405 [Candidatus Peregrinibacteria bacterium]|nr:hypothetical protein [Candidatus Peregrinibacteria bacterium]
MSLFKHFDWSAKSIAKVAGLALLGVAAIAVAVALISFSFRTIFSIGEVSYRSSTQGMMDGGYAYDMAMEEAAYGGNAVAYGTKMMAPSIAPTPDFSSGTDAENYEVKSYYASVETRKLDETCKSIGDLKAKDYVIFEDSNKNDDSCYYRFKVEKDKADEVVKLLEDMNPKTFDANIQSIKRNVEGIEDELEILKKQLTSIEETLENAQSAYDEISTLATRQQDAETLAKIIDSKLNLIERLTNQRLQTKNQIDRYNEVRADQLDRLNYTFFNVNIYENLLLDWKQIKDSWKYETQALVRNINSVFQAITLNLVTYLVRFAQVVLYLFISVFLLKFVWVGAKKIWKGEFKRKRRG